MRDPPPAALSCAVLSGLIGLAHTFCPWNSSLQEWKSCTGTTRQNFLLLAFYFTVYFVAILILSFEITPDLLPQLLFELSWLNGLCVEAAFLQRNFSIPKDICGSITLRILVVVIATTVGLLQVAGFAISFFYAVLGRYLAFAGARFFHVCAAAVFIFPLKYEIARHRSPIFFALAYTFAAISGSCFVLISNGNTFLLANYVLECVLNLAFLAFAQNKRNKDDGNGAASLRDEDIPSAHLGLEDSLDTERGTADKAQSPLQIDVTEDVTVQYEQYGLLTPPPTPEFAGLSTSSLDGTNARTNYSILDITVSEIGVVYARVLARRETQDASVLRLITMEWDRISHNWGLQLEEHIGKHVHDTAERLSLCRTGAGMVLLAQRDLCDIGLSPNDLQILSNGSDLCISRQMVLSDMPWMSDCKARY